MKHERFPVGVVMQRYPLAGNKWVSCKWEARGVVASAAGAREVRVLIDDETGRQVLFDGHAIELHRDEVEGYFLNLSAPQPKVFVMWRAEHEDAVPHSVTVSYHEAARLLDAGEQVDAVPMPAGIAGLVAGFVREHYRPEPKKVRRREQRRELDR